MMVCGMCLFVQLLGSGLDKLREIPWPDIILRFFPPLTQRVGHGVGVGSRGRRKGSSTKEYSDGERNED